MKQFFKTTGIILLALHLSSCAEDQPEMEESFYIEFGTRCGWCAGQEFVKVSAQKVVYTRTIPCGENEGTTIKSRHLTSLEWEAIQKAYNYNLFLTLDYNECNVCADGCDEIIRIHDDTDTHELSYSPGEEVEGMENLRTKLHELMAEFTEED